MASSKFIFNIIFVVLVLCAVVNSSPIPTQDELSGLSNREGRFYGGGGFAGSQASAMASAGAGGFGLGYPGGYGGLGGYGGSSATAAASAGSGAFGFGR